MGTEPDESDFLPSMCVQIPVEYVVQLHYHYHLYWY